MTEPLDRQPLDPEPGVEPASTQPTEPATEPTNTLIPEPPEDHPAATYSPSAATRPEWSADASPWAVPPPPPVVATNPVVAERAPRRTGTANLVVGAVLSAVLASGGTVLGLSTAGLLDGRGGTSGVPLASSAATNQPVTIDESSAIIDAAAKVGPAVVRIFVGGENPNVTGELPTEGIGSGVIF